MKTGRIPRMRPVIPPCQQAAPFPFESKELLALTAYIARQSRGEKIAIADDAETHPFIEAGNKEFNCFLWMPPAGDRAGDIVLADSTIFTTLFGGDKSLECFWKNLAIN